MPHRGLEPASVPRLDFQSDALPTELSCPCLLLFLIIIIIIIIIMYIYHAVINALSAHMIHIHLNIIFYTHVEAQSYQNNVSIHMYSIVLQKQFA